MRWLRCGGGSPGRRWGGGVGGGVVVAVCAPTTAVAIATAATVRHASSNMLGTTRRHRLHPRLSAPLSLSAHPIQRSRVVPEDASLAVVAHPGQRQEALDGV